MMALCEPCDVAQRDAFLAEERRQQSVRDAEFGGATVQCPECEGYPDVVDGCAPCRGRGYVLASSVGVSRCSVCNGVDSFSCDACNCGRVEAAVRPSPGGDQ